MEIDVIILSYVKNDSVLEMNNECIDSINNSTKNHTFKIYLIETNKDRKFEYSQDNVVVIQPDEEFNYNRFLNIGLEHCKNEWVLISNNDTIYHENFIDKMIEANEFDKDLLSMSPMDDKWHRHKKFDKNIKIYYGFRTSYEIAGWSILVKRSVIDQIGGFDEKFKFWYQDNDYAMNLIKHKIKHALITDSKVTHLLSRSHDFIEKSKRHEMTDGLVHEMINKWNLK
jgi:GT2 family glycosyltransferase